MQDEAEPATAAVTAPTRATASIGDAGELILSDGSRLGHRQFQKYYRQKLTRVVSSTEATLINSLRSRFFTVQHF